MGGGERLVGSRKKSFSWRFFSRVDTTGRGRATARTWCRESPVATRQMTPVHANVMSSSNMAVKSRKGGRRGASDEGKRVSDEKAPADTRHHATRRTTYSPADTPVTRRVARELGTRTLRKVRRHPNSLARGESGRRRCRHASRNGVNGREPDAPGSQSRTRARGDSSRRDPPGDFDLGSLEWPPA